MFKLLYGFILLTIKLKTHETEYKTLILKDNTRLEVNILNLLNILFLFVARSPQYPTWLITVVNSVINDNNPVNQDDMNSLSILMGIFKSSFIKIKEIIIN
jgi:hypothetical protein